MESVNKKIEAMRNERSTLEWETIPSRAIEKFDQESITIGNVQQVLAQPAYQSLLKHFKLPKSLYESLPEDLSEKVWRHQVMMSSEKVDFVQVLRDKESNVQAIVPQDYTHVYPENILQQFGTQWDLVSGNELPLLSPMHRLRLIDTSTDVDGDRIGVDIVTSEVGMHIFSIRIMLYVRVCSNGLMRVRNISGTGYAAYLALSYSDVSQAVIDTVVEALPQKVCSDEQISFVVDMVTQSKNDVVSIPKLVESVTIYNINVARHLMSALDRNEIGPEISVFDAAQMISAEAHGVPLKASYKFEQYAGMMMGLYIDTEAY